MRLLTVCVAALIVSGCNAFAGYYEPARFKDLKQEGIDYHEIAVSRVIIGATTGTCSLDIYFPNGRKLYVGGIDRRVCAIPK